MIQNQNPIVYINGYKIDLEAGQTVAQTKQVNDIANMDDRQANYTNRFKAADSANNRIAFDFLSFPGNASNLPYQKNEAFLFNEAGECFVYKGWANVTNTSRGYDVFIYDGLIDLYKSIDNQTLADLPLTELNHTKNLAAVIASWNPSSPYRYILADYGGKLYYDTDKINIDYLAPSVSTKYLWDKLFAFHGFTYTGSVFLTEEFINHFVTYPKGVYSTIPEETKFESDDMAFTANGSPFQTVPNTKHSVFLRYLTFTTNDLAFISQFRHFLPGEDSLYRLELSGTIAPRRLVGMLDHIDYNPPSPAGIPVYNYLQFPQQVDLWLCKNQVWQDNASQMVPLMKLNDQPIGSSSNFASATFSINKLVQVNQYDTFCVIARSHNPSTTSGNLLLVGVEDLNFSIKKVVSQDVVFDVALADFSKRDFFKEVLTRFGLTAFKGKYNNEIEFLTTQERLQTPDVEDWSDKFVRVESEAYTYGGYAQKNIFSFNYNDKESSYNDGAITIDNVNLAEKKTILKSKIYSPEKDPVIYLGRPTNTYKLWEKEVTEDGPEPIKYKALDKRFYFLRSDTITFDAPMTIGSETLGTSSAITSAPVESFFGMKWDELLQDNYSPLAAILNKSLVQNISVKLTDRDVIGLDFKKLYFIDKVASYYLLNKLVNYVTGKLAKVEMIRVFFAPPPPPFIGLYLQDISSNLKPSGWYITFAFTNSTGETPVMKNVNGVESTLLVSAIINNHFVCHIGPFETGVYTMFLSTAGFISNARTFILGDVELGDGGL